MRSTRRSVSQMSGKDSSNKKKSKQGGRKGKRKRGRKLLYTRFRTDPEPKSTSPPRTPPSSDDEGPSINIPKPTAMTVPSKSFDTSAVLKPNSAERPFPRSGSPSPPRQTERRRSPGRGPRLTARLKTSATVAPVPNPQLSGSSSFSSRDETDRRSSDRRHVRRSKQRNASGAKRMASGMPDRMRMESSSGKTTRGGLPRGVMYVAKNSKVSSKPPTPTQSKPRVENEEEENDDQSFGFVRPKAHPSSGRRMADKRDSKNKRASRTVEKTLPRRPKSTRSEKRTVGMPKKRMVQTAEAPLLPTAQAPPRPRSGGNSSRGSAPPSLRPGLAKAGQGTPATPRSVSDNKMLTRNPPMHFASPGLSATSSFTSCSTLGLTPRRKQHDEPNAYSPARSLQSNPDNIRPIRRSGDGTWNHSGYAGPVDTETGSDTNSELIRQSVQTPLSWPPEMHAPLIVHNPPPPPSPPGAPRFQPPDFSPHLIEQRPPRSAAKALARPSVASDVDDDSSDKMSPINRHYVQHHLDLDAECMYNHDQTNVLSSIPSEYSRITPQQAYHQFATCAAYGNGYEQYNRNPYAQYAPNGTQYEAHVTQYGMAYPATTFYAPPPPEQEELYHKHVPLKVQDDEPQQGYDMPECLSSDNDDINFSNSEHLDETIETIVEHQSKEESERQSSTLPQEKSDKENRIPTKSTYEIESVYDLMTEKIRFGSVAGYQSHRTERVLIEGTEKSFFGLESLGGSVYDPLWESSSLSPKCLGPIERPACQENISLAANVDNHMYEYRGRMSLSSATSPAALSVGSQLMSGLSLAPALSTVYERNV